MKKVILGLLISVLFFFGALFFYLNKQTTTVFKPLDKVSNITLPNNKPTIKIKPLETVNVALNVPILMYHYIRVNPVENDSLGYNLSVTPDNFAIQLDWLLENGYQTITLDDLQMALNKKKVLPSNSVILTFDDGYSDFYYSAFPELQQRNMKATVYVVTNFVNDKDGRYLTWNQIKELDQSGLVTIGSHSVTHANLTNVAPIKATNEIMISKSILEKFLGHTVSHFCYPSGKYNEAIMTVVKRAGYKTATTTVEHVTNKTSDVFQLKRNRIKGQTNLSSFINQLHPDFYRPKTITKPNPTEEIRTN